MALDFGMNDQEGFRDDELNELNEIFAELEV